MNFQSDILNKFNEQVLCWIQAYQLFIQKIYYNIFVKQMKFLLAAAFISTVYSQEILPSDGQVIRPPIQIYEDDAKNEKIQIKSDSQSIRPSSDQMKQTIDFVDIAQIIKKVIENQQPVKQSVKEESTIQPEYIIQPAPIPMPVPIQKFQETKQEPILIIDPVPIPIPQPIPFIQPQNPEQTKIKHKKDEKHKKHHKSAQKYESNDPFITQPNYNKKKQKLDKKKKKHLRKDKRKSHQKQEREEFIAGNQYQYENFEKQYQNGKHNKNMCFIFFLVGLISTIFGLCLGKCVRKCKKNKGKKIVYANQERSVSQIQQEIVEKQRIINDLKEQYRNKRAAEDSLIQIKRQEEAVSRAYEAQMRQIKQRRQQNYIQPPQRYMTVQNEHIPMGKPINGSKNSSFACEYPQL